MKHPTTLRDLMNTTPAPPVRLADRTPGAIMRRLAAKGARS